MTTKECFEIHTKGVIIDVINAETNHFPVGVLQCNNRPGDIIANSFAEILHYFVVDKSKNKIQFLFILIKVNTNL